LASVWARAQAEKVANEAAMAAELAQLQRPNTLKGWLNGWRERLDG
jgi:ribosome modulation factor